MWTSKSYFFKSIFYVKFRSYLNSSRYFSSRTNVVYQFCYFFIFIILFNSFYFRQSPDYLPIVGSWCADFVGLISKYRYRDYSTASWLILSCFLRKQYHITVFFWRSTYCICSNSVVLSNAAITLYTRIHLSSFKSKFYVTSFNITIHFSFKIVVYVLSACTHLRNYQDWHIQTVPVLQSAPGKNDMLIRQPRLVLVNFF